MFLLFFIV